MSATKEGLTFGKLKFTVTMKTGGNPIEAAEDAVEDMETTGVMQKGDNTVEDIKNATDTVKYALDQLPAVEAVVSPLVETIVSPLIANLGVFVDLVADVSKVCACRLSYTHPANYVHPDRYTLTLKPPGRYSLLRIRYVNKSFD